jgi:hypothetical protein
MTITSISGKRKFRVSPDDHKVVQIQRGHGARWEEYAKVDSWLEASKLVFALASKPHDETQEMPAVKAVSE